MSERLQSGRAEWLRLARGEVDFYLPAAWVRRVEGIERPSALPLAEAWVLGLAPAEGGRWLPVFDPLTAAGAAAPRHGCAALLASPQGEPLAWCLADAPGVLAGLPMGVLEPHAALPWLERLPEGTNGRERWKFDVARWAGALAAN